jgi:hypothetical protein
VVEQETIYIRPTDSEIIYVPSYSPSVVYADEHHHDVYAAGVIGFGLGITTGPAMPTGHLPMKGHLRILR